MGTSQRAAEAASGSTSASTPRPAVQSGRSSSRHHQGGSAATETPELSETVRVGALELPHLATGHRRVDGRRLCVASFERRHTRAGLPGGAPALGRVAGRDVVTRTEVGSSPCLRGPGERLVSVRPRPYSVADVPGDVRSDSGQRAGSRANAAGSAGSFFESRPDGVDALADLGSRRRSDVEPTVAVDL